MYNAVTVPTISYACESWILLHRHESQIDATEMKQQRSIAGKSKYDKIREEEMNI